MTTFTIELSDIELKALNYVAYDANDWIQNAIHERCRLAIDELANDDVQHRLKNNIPIQGTKEEMVLASTLPSGKQRHEEALASIQATLNSFPPSA